MAVGDVISVIQNSDITYQPAAGVEVMITSAGNPIDAYFAILLTNGVGVSINYINNTATNWTFYQPKIFINNSIYVSIVGNAPNYRSFCGIQIK